MIDGTDMMLELIQRGDVKVVGLVYASNKGTETLWCYVEDGPPARYETEQPSAMILLMSDGITTLVTPEWQKVGWFTRYVEQLTEKIHSQVERPR